MAWAIEQQEIKDPMSRLVLLCVANYADATGRNSFPAVSRLARDTGLCERAVQYQLRKLTKAVLLQRGNQAVVAAHVSRGDRRPVCYDLIMRGAQDAPRSVTGCTESPHGVHLETSRGAPHAPDPSLKSEENLKRVITRAEKEEFKARLRTQALASTLAQSKKVSR